MEASALKQLRVGAGPGRTRTPLLRMQSDERLVALVRRGNHAAFGVLVSRYESRLLSFCRHLLRSREDAEDVLQEVFTSAFKAMIADDRPIRVRPWLYRIARNRCLNHLRRISAIGVDSIEEHCSEQVPSTSDAVQQREDLWLLVRDIRRLPESQRSALLLREMEALSYEQIAEVMERTVPSVKSLLIRARRGLAEAAEARTLTCVEAMVEVGEWQLGARERPSRVVRRHVRECGRCAGLGRSDDGLAVLRAVTALAPVALLRKLLGAQLVHSARAGSTAAGAGAAAAPSVLGGSATAGFVSAGLGGLAAKTAVGLTAAALGVAGAVVVDNGTPAHSRPATSAPSATFALDGPTGGASVDPAASAAAPRPRAHAPVRFHARRGPAPAPPSTLTTPSTPAAGGHASTTPTTTIAAAAPPRTAPTGGATPTAQTSPPASPTTSTVPTTSTGSTTPASTTTPTTATVPGGGGTPTPATTTAPAATTTTPTG